MPYIRGQLDPIWRSNQLVLIQNSHSSLYYIVLQHTVGVKKTWAQDMNSSLSSCCKRTEKWSSLSRPRLVSYQERLEPRGLSHCCIVGRYISQCTCMKVWLQYDSVSALLYLLSYTGNINLNPALLVPWSTRASRLVGLQYNTHWTWWCLGLWVMI